MELVLAMAAGAALMSRRKQSTPHDETIESPPSALSDVYMLHDSTQGIPQSNRWERQTPSHLYSVLGSVQQQRSIANTNAKVQRLLTATAAEKSTVRAFTPTVSQLPTPKYEGQIMQAIKADTLPCKSQGDIALETWRSAHREDRTNKLVRCCE